MKNKEWSPAELRSKMEAYCAHAEHCESEARMRLRQWHCDSKTENDIIDHLIDQNYISDERYAKAFVHDKLLYQGWGRVKIGYMLRAKKIAPDIIQTALQNIDETEYFRILTHLISQRVKSSQNLSREDLASLYRFLTQRGFTMEEIKGAGLFS